MPQAPVIEDLGPIPKTLASAAGSVEDLGPIPNFTQTDKSPNELAPNTLGTLAKTLWSDLNPVQFGQLLPFPKALGGSGFDNPLSPVNPKNPQWAPSTVMAMQAVKQQGDALIKQGDYVGAITKYVESVVPVIGPWMSQRGDEAQHHQWMQMVGHAVAMAANVKAGAAIPEGLSRLYPLADHPMATAAQASTAAPAVQFAQQRGVPLDAATVSDNLAVKGAQAIADRSLGGSLVATPARAAQAAKMTSVGEDLASDAHALPTTPEQAGLGLRQALTDKIAGHTTAANEAYDTIRTLEQRPSNQMAMPLKPQAVDALAEGQAGQLRRIVHELDAAPYNPATWVDQSGIPGPNRGNAGGGQWEKIPASGGADVFNDIVQRMPGTSTPTRAVVQNQLEAYIAGGPETSAVKAALEVAQARSKGQGGGAVSRPELPPSAMEVPTRLEASRVTSEQMGFPVDLSGPKAALRPLYDQMKRQMPITQQQASPGLKAIENILTGPDFGSLSQIDRDLSAIKSVARAHGGLAKMAVTKLEAAVTQAAQNGGPEVWDALKRGRAETTAKYAATDVLDALRDEPVRAIAALTSPKDAAIQQLRTVTQQVPEQAPVIARAYLEDLLAKPNKVAEWSKLGAQTKQILFPKAGQAQALDQFFALTKRISDTNVNPSGSGYIAALGAQGAMLFYDPIHAVPLQVGAAGVAQLLRSPAAINALTRGLSLPPAAPMTVKTATFLQIVKTAREAGVPLAIPQAADQGPSQ